MTSVKQKLAGINKKKAEVVAGARKLQGAIRQQEKINAAAISNIQTGIRKVGEGIKAKGREIDAGSKKVQATISIQAAENKAYIKDFYFGDGKK